MNPEVKARLLLDPQAKSKFGHLSPTSRRQVARIFERWARQLRTSAAIQDWEAARAKRRPGVRVGVRRIARRQLALN